MKKKVLVALSGGIDSTVTASLLQEQGYEVIGIHFRFHGDDHKSASSGLRLISEKLGIGLIHYDARRIFEKEVVQYMTSMHLDGKTPSPCAICNPRVKWRLLAELSESYSCDYFATGHYIRILDKNGQRRFYQGKDTAKDQSYYLWGVRANHIEHSLAPLGDYRKDEVREMAASIGFSELITKDESMGLCFSDHASYNEFLHEKIENINIGTGKVYDRRGNLAGTHLGYPYYTIGQKKELSLDDEYRKWCVAEINPSDNTLIIDRWENLYEKEFLIGDCHFYEEEELNGSIPVQARVRGFGKNPGKNCKLIKKSEGSYQVILEEPAWAIAPGQPVVFYSGDLLIGGGIAN